MAESAAIEQESNWKKNGGKKLHLETPHILPTFSIKGACNLRKNCFKPLTVNNRHLTQKKISMKAGSLQTTPLVVLFFILSCSSPGYLSSIASLSVFLLSLPRRCLLGVHVCLYTLLLRKPKGPEAQTVQLKPQ